MRFFNIVLAFTITAMASAWKIPQGVTDGVYKVETLADGTAVHTRVIAASGIDQPEAKGAKGAPEAASTLEKRSSGQTWCGCGFTLVPGDCDAAVANLKNQLSPKIVYAGQAYYSIRGRVVAFACNRGSQNWLVAPFNIDESLAQITNSCGRYIAGAMQDGDDGQALLIGYQRWSGNDDFCGNARNSPVNHC